MSNKEMSESAAPTTTESRKLIPKELAIETVFGCNLSCPMCFIDMPTKRKKGVMTMELFHSIVDSMAPYVNEIERVDLWSLGEPLLDHHLFERIGLLKERGFCNLAISTNADLMDADRRRGLLESGIETIIISIDGIDKQTYEKIRHGADFDRVVSNTENIIKMRDEGDYDTRFIIRFIRQADNFDQWERFKQFWNARLSQEKRDFATLYDMHNHGGYIAGKEDLIGCDRVSEKVETKPCHHIFRTMIVLVDGSLALCSADFLEAQFDLGNLPVQSPIEAFNSREFNAIRDIHALGNKRKIKLCGECTVLYSEQTRETGWDRGM